MVWSVHLESYRLLIRRHLQLPSLRKVCECMCEDVRSVSVSVCVCVCVGGWEEYLSVIVK